MPCQDSSSGLNMRLDLDDRLIDFDFAKITCSSPIGSEKKLSQWCKGKLLSEILELDFRMLVSALNLNNDPEAQFILYLELDALKAAIVQYLGIEYLGVDCERARISSIAHTDRLTEVALVIFPPQELPKIIACGLKDKINENN